MELSTVFGGDALKAADLQGNEPTVTIESVTMKDFDDGNKLIITFVGKKKSLVCNKTNANRIAHFYGSNTDNWRGKEIVLFTDLVDFQGRTVEAIRVRGPQRQAPQAAAQSHQRPLEPVDAGPRADMDDEIPFAPEFR